MFLRTDYDVTLNGGKAIAKKIRDELPLLVSLHETEETSLFEHLTDVI